MVKRKFRKDREETLGLEDLQAMRDGSKNIFSRKKIQTAIDLHFLPPKPRKQKKQKKEKRYRERN